MAAHVVANSVGVAENVVRIVRIPRERVTTIYNPTFTRDITRFAEEDTGHPWLESDGIPLVWGVGRLVPQKDFSTLLEAFFLVRAKRPCRLIILGEGPMRQQLEGRVSALGLRDCVSLPGWVENPWAFVTRASLFVLSSRHEGFPGVLVEALACGCPAVSTDCPAGPSEIIEDPSLLAPVGNSEALSSIILRALSHPVDRAILQKKASRFSVQLAAKKYEAIVEEVLAADSGGT